MTIKEILQRIGFVLKIMKKRTTCSCKGLLPYNFEGLCSSKQCQRQIQEGIYQADYGGHGLSNLQTAEKSGQQSLNMENCCKQMVGFLTLERLIDVLKLC